VGKLGIIGPQGGVFQLLSPTILQILYRGGISLLFIVDVQTLLYIIIKRYAQYVFINTLGIFHPLYQPLIYHIKKGDVLILYLIVQLKLVLFKFLDITFQKVTFGRVHNIYKTIKDLYGEIIVNILGLIMPLFQNIGNKVQQQLVLIVVFKSFVGKAT